MDIFRLLRDLSHTCKLHAGCRAVRAVSKRFRHKGTVGPQRKRFRGFGVSPANTGRRKEEGKVGLPKLASNVTLKDVRFRV